ncbi:MAG TPA: ATP-binding protein [Aggregatilinea sp.]|uniref:ATP-binding protein n=1 Tax=Aggregatilinea sp. TaxID=2806333 RepID=UPI002BA97852|nr:ATP-binding protein [Aggregatilinea sp.]HML21476.1 ATP-binding protein [Aggregatilinea sp.]
MDPKRQAQAAATAAASPATGHAPERLSKRAAALGIGAALTLFMALWAAAGGPGANVVAWLAIAPLAVGTGYVLGRVPLRDPGTDTSPDNLHETNQSLRQQVQDLIALRDAILELGARFDHSAILAEIPRILVDLLHVERGLVLLYDENERTWHFGAFNRSILDTIRRYKLEQIQIAASGTPDPLIDPWLRGEPVLVEDAASVAGSALYNLLAMLDFRGFYAVPLRIGESLKGAILVDNADRLQPISLEQRSLLDALAANLAVTLEKALLYTRTDEQLTARVQELRILGQIDRELNAALSMDRVINLAFDWALRFTGSNTAALALVDPDTGAISFNSAYGYSTDEWEQLRAAVTSVNIGVTGRVVRSGQPEIIPDVSSDPDYIDIVKHVRSLLAVPMIRDERVTGVLLLSSYDLNGFTEDNLEFVTRLATRVAVALDNARLFDETRREQKKLEVILSSTTDAVIVVQRDGRLALVNQAAMAIFHLAPKAVSGRPSFDTVLGETPLARLYRRAQQLDLMLVEEIKLEDDRTFHTSIMPVPEVGWTILLHDVTPFKRTEQLKTELVATASHDLKNPLSVILGYLDLISMTHQLTPQGTEYMNRVHQAVAHMRELIDDLLDMARIESGLILRYHPVSLEVLFSQEAFTQSLRAEQKNIRIEVDIPPTLPIIEADEQRLRQIANNLISNAIKYTPGGGSVTIIAAQHGDSVRVAIRDTGIGIGPEDQAQIFTRFYRVRSAETEGIEGTGLGLAIVKSLVEAHGGELGMESRLGEGSTFFFTLPIHPPQAGDDALEPHSAPLAGDV